MDNFDDRMAVLRGRFIERTAIDVERMRAGIVANEWLEVRDICHGLAGRAGMFGFAVFGETARALEESIDRDEVQTLRIRLADRLLAEAGKIAQCR